MEATRIASCLLLRRHLRSPLFTGSPRVVTVRQQCLYSHWGFPECLIGKLWKGPQNDCSHCSAPAYSGKTPFTRHLSTTVPSQAQRNNPSSNFDYCVSRVRLHDYEHYLSLLLLPPASRRVAMVVRAFNIEVSQAAGSRGGVGQTATGVTSEAVRGRLAFWRDAVAAMYKTGESNEISSDVPPDADDSFQPSDISMSLSSSQASSTGASASPKAHSSSSTSESVPYRRSVPAQPVAQELNWAIKSTRLSRRWLTGLINARQRLFGSSNHGLVGTLAELEEFAGLTCSPCYYLTLEAVGVRNVDADHAASHLGKCQGTLNILRSLTQTLHRGERPLLPVHLLRHHGVKDGDLLRGTNREAVAEVVYEVACVANDNLNKCETLLNDRCQGSSGIGKHGMRVFVPLVVYKELLETLRRVKFDPFDPLFTKKQPLLPLKLLYASVFKYR